MSFWEVALLIAATPFLLLAGYLLIHAVGFLLVAIGVALAAICIAVTEPIMWLVRKATRKR